MILVDKWDEPAPLTRAWCVWEVFTVARLQEETGKMQDVRVVLPAGEEERLRQAIRKDVLGIVPKFGKIDVLKAKAFSEEDRAMIVGMVEELGADEVQEAAVGLLKK